MTRSNLTEIKMPAVGTCGPECHDNVEHEWAPGRAEGSSHAVHIVQPNVDIDAALSVLADARMNYQPIRDETKCTRGSECPVSRSGQRR
jgi:hypothetical protein